MSLVLALCLFTYDGDDDGVGDNDDDNDNDHKQPATTGDLTKLHKLIVGNCCKNYKEMYCYHCQDFRIERGS